MHHNDGVFRLLLCRHLRDPAGEGQDTIASNSPDQARGSHSSHRCVEDETEYADHVHHDVAASAHGHIIQAYERLRCIQLVESVEVWQAEKEKDDKWETDEGGRNG